MAAACRLLLADSADRPMINHLHAQGMVAFRGRQVSGRGEMSGHDVTNYTACSVIPIDPAAESAVVKRARRLIQADDAEPRS